MSDIFIKKELHSESLTVYLHFQGEYAIREIIELDNELPILLDMNNPIKNECFLYDQNLSDLEYDSSDIITKFVFDRIWNCCVAKIRKYHG